jgi:hypothetical protein
MSTPKKVLAKGTIVKLCEVGGTLATFGRIETFDPPGQEYEEVQVPELNPVDDTGAALPDDPIELGDEIPSTFGFVQYWDPRDTDAQQIDTWFADKEELTVAFVTPHATSATISCNGRIKKLGPQQLAKKNYFKREVLLVRTSVITNAATP